jgi:hypothetical protein
MERFAEAQKSQTEAIGTVADVANAASAASLLARTAGAVTLTPAQMINGIISQGGTPGAFNMTTPTASALAAAMPNCQIGSAFDFVVRNGGDGAITIVAGSGVDLVGTTAVPAGFSQVYKAIAKGSEGAVTGFDLVGLLHANQLQDLDVS